jgi:PII-like signaling protein
MLCVTIRIKSNDSSNGKLLHNTLIEFLMKHHIAGATIWAGVDGFGKRKRSTLKLEGITITKPLVIEVIDEASKLEPLLVEIKQLVNDNGLVTLHETYAI